MALQHKMHGTIQFKKGVTADEVLTALKPISAYFQWPADTIMKRYLQGDTDIIQLVDNGGLLGQVSLQAAMREGDELAKLDIRSRGEVGYNYSQEVLRDVAENLYDIAEPGCLTFVGDEGEPEDIWFAAPEAYVLRVKQDMALETAVQILSKSGLEVALDELRSIAKPKEPSPVRRPRPN